MTPEYTQTTSMIAGYEQQCLLAERELKSVFSEYGRGDYLEASKRCDRLRDQLHWLSEQVGTLAVCIHSQHNR